MHEFIWVAKDYAYAKIVSIGNSQLGYGLSLGSWCVANLRTTLGFVRCVERIEPVTGNYAVYS